MDMTGKRMLRLFHLFTNKRIKVWKLSREMAGSEALPELTRCHFEVCCCNGGCIAGTMTEKVPSLHVRTAHIREPVNLKVGTCRRRLLWEPHFLARL